MSTFLAWIGNVAARCLVCTVAALVTLGPVAVTHARSSRVDAAVTLQPDGTFLYEFTVHNTTPSECLGCDVIVNWELPIFAITDLVDPTSITSPPGWEFEIILPNASTSYYNNVAGPYGQYRWTWDPLADPTLAADLAAYGPNPDVFTNPPLLIHWFTCDTVVSPSCAGGNDHSPANPILEGRSLGGFSFRSAFNQAPAPYQASWFQNPPTTGDPPIPGQPGLGTPNSPKRQAAQEGVVAAAFKVKRAAAMKTKHGVGFDIRGRFATDPTKSDGINMPEDITISLGSFSQTIPADAFVLDDRDDDGTFEFEGDPGGITRVSIGNDGHVRIRGWRVDLGNVDLRGPLPFSLQIGNDLAEVDIRFNRRHGRDHHDHNRHRHDDHD